MKCRNNTESNNPKIVKTKNGKIMYLSKCSVCNSKKWKFLKEQEAKRLLSNLTGVNISFLTDLAMLKDQYWEYKMNAIVNKFLLEEMNLC